MLGALRVLVPGLLLTAAACGRSRPAEVHPNALPAYVEVRNQHALPMEIYAIGSGISHRMGTVHPGMGGHFVVPQNLIGSGSVHLEARPGTSGQPFRSGELLIAPGAVVDFVVGDQLFNSTATLRPGG